MSELSFFGGYGPTQFNTLVSAGILVCTKQQHYCGVSISPTETVSFSKQFYRNKSKHEVAGDVPMNAIVSAGQNVPYVG